MVMERRGERSLNPISTGRHVGYPKSKTIRISQRIWKTVTKPRKRTMVRLTIILCMFDSALVGAIIERIVDNGWPF